MGYTRPYSVAFAAGVVAAVTASMLDGFTFALLIPFLRLLFGLSPTATGAGTDGSGAGTAVEQVLDGLLGSWLHAGAPLVALRNVVIVLLAAIALKNLAVYLAGYLRILIQERVARDLRLALYDHVQRLGLSFFQGVRGGRLVAHAAADADQAKTLVGQTLTAALQNGALVLVYVAILFALLLGIFVPALAFLQLGGAYRGILLGAAIATCVGVVDDFRGLPWWAKLAGQVTAAAVAVGSGVEVDRFTFPFLGIQDLPAWFRWVARINPMTWQVDLLRFSLLGVGDPLTVVIQTVAYLAFACLGLAMAVRALNRVS